MDSLTGWMVSTGPFLSTGAPPFSDHAVTTYSPGHWLCAYSSVAISDFVLRWYRGFSVTNRPLSLACLILPGDGDEFLLGHDALKELGIDVKSKLVQFVG
ncbi:hypothetical protein PHMEG_0002518 [Phytophthora megakarya]|uniref:Uncharacterized protein n=1 Tax=Phytophthora megakarya TaxID=4795 RepID=A0A225WYU4_9STRA|nr:hypothetical protein PHMEG_0002518 [Phytophthora megakarya]